MLGLAIAAPSAATAAPGSFLVGAAKVDITPPPFDKAKDPPAFAACAAGFTGTRRFQFEEPYVDSDGNGRYDFGVTNGGPPEPYCDANGNGHYDGIFSSGAVDAAVLAVHDPIDVRAIAISANGQTYVIASVVAQGIFENYIEEMRKEVQRRRPQVAGVVVSSNHNESSPDTVGIYGSPSLDIDGSGVNASARSGIDEYYMDWLIQRVADAAVAAVDAMKPGTLNARQVLVPPTLRVDLSNNFPTTYDSEDKPAAIDPKIGILQARDASGKAVFTVMSLAAHNQEIGHSRDDDAALRLSSDWPGYFASRVEALGGGMGIFLVGDNGSEEDPETVPPVGCATGCHQQAEATGRALADAVAAEAPRSARVRPGAPDVQRSELYVPLENNLFRAAAAAGIFGERQT
jgi:hypothetical protein